MSIISSNSLKIPIYFLKVYMRMVTQGLFGIISHSTCKVSRERHNKYLLPPPAGGAISGEWRPVPIWASIRCCCPSPQDRHDCIRHTGLRPDPQNQPLAPTAGVDQPAGAGQRQERIWAHEWIQVRHDNHFLCLILFSARREMSPPWLDMLDMLTDNAVAAINVDVWDSTVHFLFTFCF